MTNREINELCSLHAVLSLLVGKPGPLKSVILLQTACARAQELVPSFTSHNAWWNLEGEPLRAEAKRLGEEMETELAAQAERLRAERMTVNAVLAFANGR